MSLLTEATLVVTPNANKTGKLYSVIPSNGNGDFTVTRATTATRVNSAGLVEVVPYNLLTWSEMFSDASWVKNNSSITANTTTAPDGTLTADTLTELATTAFHAINQSLTLNANKYTFSFYAKPNGRNFIQWNNSVVSDYVNFNIATGAIGSSQNVTNATTENVGNGWYKCSFEYTATSATGTWYRLTLITSATSARLENYLGDGTSGAFIWGAQINEGTPLTYLRTETRLNIPRLDYSLGSCPNLLLEPQRTNLALRSEEFDNSTWFKTAGIVVTPNALISPSGVLNADYIQFGASNRLISQTTSLGIGVVSTGSIYIKGTAGETIALGVGGLDTLFTLNGNWQRIEATKTSVNAVFNINTFGGATARNIYLWGAQLEAGAYATSYIPTTTASVTRNSDVVNKTGISSLIGQTEGVIYWEGISTIQTDILGTNRSTVNGIYITKGSGNLFRIFIYNSSNVITLTDTIIRNSNTKIAISYKSGNTSLFVNGVKVATSSDSLTFNASLDAIRLNDDYLIGAGTYFTKSVLVYKTALTDTQLTQLTTL